MIQSVTPTPAPAARALAEDAAKTHPDPSVKCRERRTPAVFEIFIPAA